MGNGEEKYGEGKLGRKVRERGRGEGCWKGNGGRRTRAGQGEQAYRKG